MDLDKFFKAKTVAVIGVSENPSKVGHVIFRNFIEEGFSGKVYPVNPNLESILGYTCYKSVLDIPGEVELGIVAIPAKIILSTIKECGKKGIHDLVIITSGFDEIGNHSLAADMKKLLDQYKIRVIGPNCLGVYDAHTKLDSLFLPADRLQRPSAGGISFVCQSGAAGSALLDLAAYENYGFAKFISYGNAVNVNETDIIEYLGNDPDTKVICLYVEGVKAGRRFIDVCQKVSLKKPIVAIKGGVSEAGAAAAMSHTGSLAGSAAVYEGVFKQAGVLQVPFLRDMFSYARILETSVKPAGKRIQIITNGGGYGILCTDAIERYGLEMAHMDAKTQAELKKHFSELVIVNNPIDLIGDADNERYRLSITAALNDKNVDIVLVVLLFQTPLITSEIVSIVSELTERQKKPIVTISTGGDYTRELQEKLSRKGVPTFTFPNEAVKAIKALCDYWL
ncbi:MAG: CoA-binding protein [Candidatus Woesearchaeota archaeon]